MTETRTVAVWCMTVDVDVCTKLSIATAPSTLTRWVAVVGLGSPTATVTS